MKPIDYCYGSGRLTEEEVREWLSESKEIPIMGTSPTLDYFLIKNCPLKVVQERMGEVYDKEYINSILKGTSKYDTFVRPKPGKHFRITERIKTTKSRPWYYEGRKYRGYYSIEVENTDIDGYNEECDSWIFYNELGEPGWYGSISVKARSLKALFRKIMSWNLPIGTVVEVNGRFIDEHAELIITK